MDILEEEVVFFLARPSFLNAHAHRQRAGEECEAEGKKKV